MIGIVMLMGLVTKNAILLVDFANHCARTARPAVRGAAGRGRVRLRPILMTTLAMVFGMLPLAFGWVKAAAARADGPAVIGGLITRRC